MPDQTNIPARSPSRQILAPESSNPFRLPAKRLRSLRVLKRALVTIGLSGSRRDFVLVKRAFALIPELRSA